MKFTQSGLAASLALTFAASGAHAVAVTGLSLGDTIDAATGGLGADGKSGAFRFAPINPVTYSGAALFDGNVNGGCIDVRQTNPAGSFTTGFMFVGESFVPFTSGAVDMDITGGVLIVGLLPWAGNYAGLHDFTMSPDPGTLVVYDLIQTGAYAYAYRIGWSHEITSKEDPSGLYYGLNAHWVLEGTMTTAIPEPETNAMLVAGLGLVGAVVRRRRKPGGPAT